MKKHLLLPVVVLISTQALVAQTVKWIKNPANGHFYALTSKRHAWGNADREARILGVYLATVRNKSENDWITKTFISSSVPAVWIGLTDHLKEGTLVWTTGQPLTYSNWAFSQPQNNDNNDFVQTTGVWFLYPGGVAAFGLMERIDAEFSTFGKGCASTTMLPTVSSTTPPKLGSQNFTLTVTGFLPKLQFGQLILGGSNTHWGVIPLPMPLTIIGANNCSLHVSMDSPLLIVTDAQGSFRTTMKVPALPTFLGATVYGQAWAPDPKSNPVGIATTNAFKVRIGGSRG